MRAFWARLKKAMISEKRMPIGMEPEVMKRMTTKNSTSWLE